MIFFSLYNERQRFAAMARGRALLKFMLISCLFKFTDHLSG